MFLIDGYNLLHAQRAPWRVTSRRPLPAAARLLVERVSDLCARRNAEALVVFDGNPPPDPPGTAPHVRVRFTGRDRSADDLLAELVAGVPDAAAGRTVVVSSDRAVASRARAETCRTITSEEFLGLFREKAPRSAGSGRDHALSDREVDAWLKKFGFS